MLHRNMWFYFVKSKEIRGLGEVSLIQTNRRYTYGKDESRRIF